MQNCIKFYLNGNYYQVSEEHAFTNLSVFIRTQKGLTGTKEVCCEGDCGACSVLLGKFTQGKFVYETVNSCILLMAQVNNCHVITVEGLRNNGKLNQLQQSFIENGGAQCGFCTPGMIVTLYSYFDKTTQPKANSREIKQAIAGNLCRCTGYIDIINSATNVKPCDISKLNQLYPLTSLTEITQPNSVSLTANDKKYFQPTSLNQALQLKKDYPAAKIIAGGSDLNVVKNKHGIVAATFISLSAIEDLQSININNGLVAIGAAASLSQLEVAAKQYFPQWREYLEFFASPQIKNVATLIGNIANASPIGDNIPLLLVMNALIEISSIDGVKIINMNELYLGYKQLALRPEEIITRIMIPQINSAETLRIYKVARRKHLDISAISAAFKLIKRDKMIEQIRISYGGVGAVVCRQTAVEQFLCGKPWTYETILAASELLVNEIAPISDVRASKDYRIKVAQNLLVKFYYDVNKGII